MCVYVYISAVKQLIPSKIKVFVNIMCVCVYCVYIYIYIYIYINTHACAYLRKIVCIFTSGGLLSVLTCCVNVRLL